MVLNWLKNTSKGLWLPFFADSVLWNESLDLDLKLTILNSLLYFSPNTHTKYQTETKDSFRSPDNVSRGMSYLFQNTLNMELYLAEEIKSKGASVRLHHSNSRSPYIRKNYLLIMRHIITKTQKNPKTKSLTKNIFLQN